MRSTNKTSWGITHSLTPKNQIRNEKKWEPLPIPQLPQRKKTNSFTTKPSERGYIERSRKHRLKEERNTQIQKTNRMLYEKIRKIMQKGSKSQRKVQPQPQLEEEIDSKKMFLNTATKPLSLPHVSTNISSMRSTRSELSNILDDRGGYAQKYFQELSKARENQLSTQLIGQFDCYGWKVKVLLLDKSEYVVLKGKKGKKQLTKKYLKSKVSHKIESGLEEWVNSKFQFEI